MLCTAGLHPHDVTSHVSIMSAFAPTLGRPFVPHLPVMWSAGHVNACERPVNCEAKCDGWKM